MGTTADPIRVLLADENVTSRERTISLIRNHESLQLGEVVTSLEDLYRKMAAPMGPEIALINARLEGKPVFPTLRRLRSRPPIVLVSRERDFAPEAFEIRALDYLLIPFGPRRFAHAMQRAILQARRRREKLSRNQEFGLLLYRAGEFNLVPFERIQYLQSENKGTLVEADGKQFESRKYLAELGRRLPSRMFQRIHRQYIVNVSQIARIRSVSGGRYALSLRDNAERSTLPVGARYARELISLLKA